MVDHKIVSRYEMAGLIGIQIRILIESAKIKKRVYSKAKECAAGVVVSCKIPILATRVRFPGGAGLAFLNIFLV